jgi:lactoylglutathione lyase
VALREARLVERELELGACDFYTRELGAQGSPLYHDPTSGRWAAFLDFGGVGLELIEPAAAVEPPSSGRSLGPARIAFALGSADAVDHLSARLAAAGHPLVQPPHRSWEGSYLAVILDPDGNHIELTV